MVCREPYYGTTELILDNSSNLINTLNTCLPKEKDRVTKNVFESYLKTKSAYCEVQNIQDCTCFELFVKKVKFHRNSFRCVTNYSNCKDPKKFEELSIFESENFTRRCSEDAFEPQHDGQRKTRYWMEKIVEDNKFN